RWRNTPDHHNPISISISIAVPATPPEWCTATHPAPRKGLSTPCRDPLRHNDRSVQSVLLSVESVSPLLSLEHPERQSIPPGTIGTRRDSPIMRTSANDPRPLESMMLLAP